MEAYFWLSIIGSWALLISQSFALVAINRYLLSHSFVSFEANFVSFGLLLFGTSTILSLVFLASLPFWIATWILALFVFFITYRNWQPKKEAVSSQQNIWSRISIVALTFWGILISLSKPEGSVDGMLYHGVTLGNILNNRGLWDWSVGNAYSYYSDSAMVTAAQLSRLTPTVHLDDFVGVPYLVVTFLLLQVIIGRVIKKANLVSLMSLLILAAPVIWIHSRILYVDLIYSAALCSAIFVCSLQRFNNWLVPLLGFFSIAALMGTKPTGLAISLILLAILTIRIFVEKNFIVTYKLILLSMVSFVGGLAFYARNWILWQNPFYPISYEIGNIQFPGVIDLELFASDGGREYSFFSFLRILDFGSSVINGVVHGVEKMDYDPRIGGFGKSPLLILLVAFLLLAFRFVQNRDSKQAIQAVNDTGSKLHFKLIPIILLAMATLSLQPNSFNSRYVMASYILLLAVFVVAVLSVSPNLDRHSSFLGLVIFLCLLWSIRWSETNMVLGSTSIEVADKSIPRFNTGVSGGSWQQGEAFTWLPKEECVSVYVDKGPGVTASGMVGYSVTDVLPYGFFGNRLCNDVHFVPGGLPRNQEDAISLNSADYIVTFLENKDATLSFTDECVIREFLVNNPENGLVLGQHAQVVSEMKKNCED